MVRFAAAFYPQPKKIGLIRNVKTTQNYPKKSLRKGISDQMFTALPHCTRCTAQIQDNFFICYQNAVGFNHLLLLLLHCIPYRGIQ